MNVFLGFDRMAPHFGPGTASIATVAGLCRRGHRVTVFVEEPVEPDNQYLSALRAAGAELRVPSALVTAAARALRLEQVLLVLLLPVRAPLALLDAALRRRSLARSWHGVRGRVRARLPAAALGDPLRWALWRQLDRIHGRQPADLLHMMTGVGSAFAWARQRGVPIVYNENIVPTADGPDWWRDVIVHAGAVRLTISVCAAAEPAIRSVLGYQGPIAVVPGTIADPRPLGARPATLDGVCVIGTAARLSPVKGIDVLLRACARLVERGAPPVQLWLAGDGPQRAELEALAQSLGVAPHVRFLGACDAPAMAAFWQAIDVFSLASHWEGLPLVILEAMAYAKPVVATAVNGIPEAVRAGETGVLVGDGAVEAFADALLALAGDRAARSAMGRAGRERFLAEFGAEAMVERTLDAYRRVLPHAE